jgi:hypothetical protein
MRGVPRERRAMACAPSGSTWMFISRAERVTIAISSSTE